CAPRTPNLQMPRMRSAVGGNCGSVLTTQQSRQLGDIRRDPSRLIAAQAAWSLTTTELFLIVLPRSLGFPLGALGSSCISKAATLFVWCLLSRPASRHLMSG